MRINLSELNAMQAKTGSRSKTILILNFCARWQCTRMFKATLGSLTPENEHRLNYTERGRRNGGPRAD
jgi:hypothetical protein